MDTLCKAKKLQAKNNYYYYKITQFLHNIIFNLLIAFTFSSLFCSYPYWFPFLKKLVFDFSFSPKCLFVVVNVIVVFLVGESKLIGSSSSSSSPINEIYDDYVERSRNLRGFCFQEKTEQSKLEFKNLTSIEEKRVNIIQDYEQEKEVVKELIESSMQKEEEEEEEEEDFKEVAQEEFQDQELEVDQEVEVKEEAKDQEDEEIKDGEDQESEITAEELNRRVEEFIARVNKQRWLEEARLLVCCRA